MIQELSNIVNYLYASERADYERNPSERHIYLDVQKVQEWLGDIVDEVHGLI